MSSISSASAASAASTADPSSVQGAASTSVLKKALKQESSSVAQLIQSVAQPALATSGSLGTQVNTYA